MVRRTACWAAVACLAAPTGLFWPGCRCIEAISGLARKKQRAEIGGGDAMSRLGAPATRAQAARELGAARAVEAAEALKGYLKDKDAQVRLACVWALGQIGDPNAIADVRVLLTDHAPAVRGAAAEALGNMPGDEAVLWLGQTLLNDAVTQVRLAAVEALGSVASPASATWLLKGTDDAEPAVVSAEGRALIRVGAAALKPIHSALPALGPEGRLLAMRALAAMRDANTAEALTRGLDYCTPAPGRLGVRYDERSDAPARADAADALAALGPAAVPPLARTAVHKAGNFRLKQETAAIF